MSRRSDFFLQPLEQRKLLSGGNAASAESAADRPRIDESASLHPAERALDQQVAQLRSALTEMADRMQHLQRVLDANSDAGSDAGA